MGLMDTIHRQFSALFGEPVDTDLRKVMHAPSLRSLVPHGGYEPQRQLFFSESNAWTTFEMTPLLGATSEVDRMLEELFRDGVADGGWISVSAYVSPRIGPDLFQWAQPRLTSGGLVAGLSAERFEHLRKGAWESLTADAPFLIRDFRVFITLGSSESKDQRKLDELCDLRARYAAAFGGMRCHVSTLDAKAMIGLLREILNPSRKIGREDVQYDPRMLVSEQCVHADTITAVYKDSIRMRTCVSPERSLLEANAGAGPGVTNWTEVRPMVVTRFPESWRQGAHAGLLGHMMNDAMRPRSPMLVTYNARYSSFATSKTESERRVMRASQQKANPFSAFYPVMGAKADEWMDAQAMVQDGARIVRHMMSVVLFARDREGEAAERTFRHIWQSCGFEVSRGTFTTLPVFLASLPGGFGEYVPGLEAVKRLTTGVSSNVGAVVPLQGDITVQHRPDFLFVTPRGQPFTYSVFETGGNFNTVVVGASGSGKSVLMQEAAFGVLSGGGEVAVIDDGRSFQNLTKAFGGRQIVFSLNAQVCLNPLSRIDAGLAAQDDEYKSASLQMVRDLVLMMAKGDEKPTREEVGLIERGVSETWITHSNAGGVEEIALCLEAMGSELAQRLAIGLESYRSRGNFGAYFNGPANFDLHPKLTVFEMAELESKKDLRQVVILAILALLGERFVRSGRTVRRLLIIDEAWAMLGDGQAGQFIEGFVRRIRKYGGGLMVGTQSILDFDRSAGAKAALDNSDNMILMRMRPESLDYLDKTQKLSLDDAKLAVLKSLSVNKARAWSEAVLTGPNFFVKARLVLDPVCSALFSSSADDFTFIEQRVSQGENVMDAVRELARLRARHVGRAA
jgi:conjugal transfer ATP-binding protein TraC